MSRIGRRKIELPNGVSVDIKDGVVEVKGPKGQITRELSPLVKVENVDGVVSVDVENKEDKKERSIWGTFSSHINNMVIGVTEGFKRQLEINGVGYKVSSQGNDLQLEVGYSQPVFYKVPEGVIASIEKNVITLVGIDKEKIGRVASEIRSIRKPEPYKGKGIKYIEEVIRRKAGKTAGSKSE